MFLIAILAVLFRPVLSLAVVKRGGIGRDYAALTVLAGVIAAYGFYVWPKPRYLELSPGQQGRFVQALKTVTPQKRVVLGCAATEEVCVAAAPFIRLFQDGGWRVRGNRLERGYLGIPESGVNLLVFGEGTTPDPDNPKYGLWTKDSDPDRDAILRAFSSIGIVAHKPMASKSLSAAEIGVFFGPEPRR